MIPPFDYNNNFFNFIAASTSDYGRGVNRGRRERITYTRKQLEILEDMFRQTHYPDVFKRENLSTLLGVPEGRIQVWFKNRRARFRQSNRHPFHPSNNSSLDSEDLKACKSELPEIHRSPQATPSSSSSSGDNLSNQSLSPSTGIGIPKIETFDDLKLQTHQHHQIGLQQQQQHSFPIPNPTGFDNLKDLYSMQIPMNGNFWQTTNWQNPPYYPVGYPSSYPSMSTNPAASFYGYPQHSTAMQMQQSYQNFYPSYPVPNPGYPEKGQDSDAESLPKAKE